MPSDRNDSKIFKFCRSKCHRHFKAKHNPKKFKWTKAYRKSHGKELLYDKSLEFEQKKSEPIKYDREVFIKTVQAMDKIKEIRDRREKMFWKKRMEAVKEKTKESLENQIMKGSVLIKDEETKKIFEEKKKIRDSEKIRKNISKKNKLQELLVEDDFEAESGNNKMLLE